MEVCTDRQHLINKTQHFATAKKKGAVNMAIEKGVTYTLVALLRKGHLYFG